MSTAAGLYLVRCIVCGHTIRSVTGAAWFAGAFGGGWILAWLYKRLHPSLSFYKLWAFWSAILSAVVTLLSVIGVVWM